MKSLKLVIGFALLSASSATFAADVWSIAQNITEIKTTSSTGNTYIKGAAAWGATGCTGATNLRLDKSEPAYKEMLAEVLLAKGAGSPIDGKGSCVNANTFKVNQIRVK